MATNRHSVYPLISRTSPALAPQASCRIIAAKFIHQWSHDEHFWLSAASSQQWAMWRTVLKPKHGCSDHLSFTSFPSLTNRSKCPPTYKYFLSI